MAKDKVQSRSKLRGQLLTVCFPCNLLSVSNHFRKWIYLFIWSPVSPQVSHDCFISLVWGNTHTSMQWHKFYPMHLPRTLAACQKGLILQDLLQLPPHTAPWPESQQKSKPSHSHWVKTFRGKFWVREQWPYRQARVSAGCWPPGQSRSSYRPLPPTRPCVSSGQGCQMRRRRVGAEPSLSAATLCKIISCIESVRAGFSISSGDGMAWGKNWC